MSSETRHPFGQVCKELRAELKEVAKKVQALHEYPIFLIEESYQGQHAEMHANVTLSYRHLEDAVMRLGKSIQAYDGGISIYDK